jgi:TRAP-type mannitol/chloroaromatic compound transport system permease small subunit
VAHGPQRIGSAIEMVISVAKWLVLPVVLFLMLQWPARDLLGRFSHEADDFGQLLFALYIAVAMTCATRRRTHLATDVIAHRYSPRVRSTMTRVAFALGLAPWTIFVLVTSGPTVWRSVAALESFPETFVPGYFVVKLAVWVLAVLLLLQTIELVVRPDRAENSE